MATKESSDTLSAITDDLKSAMETPAPSDVDIKVETAEFDESQFLDLGDDDAGGHMLRNLVMLVLAATLVGAIVVVLRGRR